MKTIKLIEYIGIIKNNRCGKYECYCGNKFIARISNVKCLHTKSCGCLKNKIHGMTKTRIYVIYQSIKKRCNNKNNKFFYCYGGRGIKCLWKSFEKFRDDMYESYLEHFEQYGAKQTTIDRIDNDGHYCKENCCWVTQREQSRNKRSNHMIKYNDLELCLTDWAIKKGLRYAVLQGRIRNGWSIEKALNTPQKMK